MTPERSPPAAHTDTHTLLTAGLTQAAPDIDGAAAARVTETASYWSSHSADMLKYCKWLNGDDEMFCRESIRCKPVVTSDG